MALCFKCGATCEDTNKFCPTCGQPLDANSSQKDANPTGVVANTVTNNDAASSDVVAASSAAAGAVQVSAAQPAQSVAQPIQPTQPTQSPSSAPSWYSQPNQTGATIGGWGAGSSAQYTQGPNNGQVQSGYEQQRNYTQQQPGYGQQQPNFGQPKVDTSGIVSVAWKDVVSTEGWFPKILLLGLINCVPVLNFVVNGYMFRWGRRAAVRKGDKMPKSIFGDRAFVIGFFFWVALLCCSVVINLLSRIPFLGLIISIVCLVIAAPFINLCATRCALFGKFTELFAWGKVWNKMKNHFGVVLAIYWAPGAILVAVEFVICMSIPATCYLELLRWLMYLSYGYFVSLSVGTICIFLVAFVVLSIVSVPCYLVIARGYGEFIRRVAPDWVAEAQAKGADLYMMDENNISYSSGQMPSVQGQFVQGQPAQQQPIQSQPAQVQPAESQSAQVQPAESQPAQVQPAESQPAQVQPAYSSRQPQQQSSQGTDDSTVAKDVQDK